MATKSLEPINLKSFTCPQGKSVLDGIKTYEIMSVSDLNKLVNSNLLNTTKWTRNNWGFNIELENERDQLTKILQKISSSKVKSLSVSYFMNKSIKMGRVYPSKSLSLCSIRREVRHTLAGGVYHDIDIENCHPNILRQVCQEEGIKTPLLNKYCEEREECLKSIQETYQVDRTTAKNLIIRICYGGEFSTWCQDNEVYPTGVIDWIEHLTDELNTIGDICWERNPHLHTLTEAKSNPKRSGLSYFAQDLENRILEVMFHCLVKNKIIKKNRKSEYGCVFCFDGIMIEHENLDMSVEDLCMKLRAFVMEYTGFDLTFTEKFMNDGYDLDAVELDDAAEMVEVLGVASAGGSDLDDNIVPKDITHTYIANEFDKLYGENYIMCDNKLYYWTGDVWDWKLSKSKVRATIGEELYFILHERVMAQSKIYKDDLSVVLKKLLNLHNQTFRDKVFKDFEDKKNISRNDNLRFNFHPSQKHNIHFKNGVLMLDKVAEYETIMEKAFRKRCREDYMTSFNNYEFVLSPQKIIREIFDLYCKIQHIPETRDAWLRYMAYCLTGENNQQLCEFAIGYTAQNGKSTHLNIHQLAMPFYTLKMAKDSFDEDNKKVHKQLIKLAEKPVRLAYMEELNTKKLDAALFKEFIDGFSMSIEVMYGTRIEVELQSKFKACGNYDPNIAIDQGVLRRGFKVDYVNKFVSEDNYDEDDPLCHHVDLNLLDKFNSNIYKSAYILMLLPYYYQFKTVGLNIPQSLRKAFKNSIQEFDDLGTFLDNKIKKIKNDDNVELRVCKKDLLRKIGNLGMKNTWRSILPKMKSLGYDYESQMYCGKDCSGKFIKGGFRCCEWKHNINDDDDIDDDDIDDMDM